MAKTTRPKRPATRIMGNEPRSAAPGILPDRLGEHASAIALLTNAFHLRHLLRLYATFDGDILEAVVLGEVAHHNFSTMIAKTDSPREFSALVRSHKESGVPPQLPTNAYSISAATGIPRETVRRKVRSLIEKHLLRRDDRGNLFTTPYAPEHFAAFTAESVAQILATCRQIGALLGDERGPDTPLVRK